MAWPFPVPHSVLGLSRRRQWRGAGTGVQCSASIPGRELAEPSGASGWLGGDPRVWAPSGAWQGCWWQHHHSTKPRRLLTVPPPGEGGRCCLKAASTVGTASLNEPHGLGVLNLNPTEKRGEEEECEASLSWPHICADCAVSGQSLNPLGLPPSPW